MPEADLKEIIRKAFLCLSWDSRQTFKNILSDEEEETVREVITNGTPLDEVNW